MIAFFQGIGAPELLIVLAVVLVVFGGSQIPKLFRSLGQAQGEFKKGLKDAKPTAEAEDETTNKASDDKKATKKS